ncbi:hypothetical protein SRHO_G00055270 [Serrasalmus rhombeus]
MAEVDVATQEVVLEVVDRADLTEGVVEDPRQRGNGIMGDRGGFNKFGEVMMESVSGAGVVLIMVGSVDKVVTEEASEEVEAEPGEDTVLGRWTCGVNTGRTAERGPTDFQTGICNVCPIYTPFSLGPA